MPVARLGMQHLDAGGSAVGRGVPCCSGAPYPITASLLRLYPPASCWLRAGAATAGHAKGQKCEAASEKSISCSLSRGGLRPDSTAPQKQAGRSQNRPTVLICTHEPAQSPQQTRKDSSAWLTGISNAAQKRTFP